MGREIGAGALVLFLAAILSACASARDGHPEASRPHVPPLAVQPARVAILVPRPSDPMLAAAYAKLESRTANLFQNAAGSRIVERTELPSIRAEQDWQYTRPAAEDSEVPLGRLIGADALVLYRIVTPNLAERIFAENGDALSPVTVLAKVVSVETGAVLWTYEVTEPVRSAGRHLARDGGFDPGIWRALDQGVDEMLAALAAAIVCEQARCEADSLR